MNLLKITPNDTLFFRNGMPFDAGENMWVGTHYIPYPSVFYGAIYSTILGQNPRKRDSLFEIEDLETVLRLGRIYIYDEENEDLYMPAPLDLFKDDRGNVKFGNIENGLLYYPSESFERVDDHFINVSILKSYAQKMDYVISVYDKDKFFCNSYKVGIKKDLKKGNVEEDHLYRVDLAEFKGLNWSYLVEYKIGRNDVKLSDKGMMKLGGRGKSCKYEILKEKPYDLEKLDEYIENKKCPNERVKMILTSPGIYKDQGWRPDFPEDIKLVYAITGKPLYIGGFDIKNSRPKPMYRSVPPGSVYVLENKSFKGKKLSCIKLMIKNSIKDSEDQFRGFNSFEVVPFKECF